MSRQEVPNCGKRRLALLGCVIIPFLAISAAPQPAIIPATAVTLQGEMRLTEALARLRANENAVVDLRPRLGEEVTNPVLTFDAGDRPFWLAVDQLAQSARLRVVPYLDQETRRASVGLLAANGRQAPVAYSGPFRLSLTRLSATRVMDDPPADRLTATIQVAWEPRYQPLMLFPLPDAFRASLDDGRTLAVDSGGAGAVKLLGEHPVEYVTRLELPPRSAARLRSLSGAFDVLLPPRWLTVNLPGLTVGAADVAEGVRVTLDRINVDPRTKTTALGLRIEYPRGALDLESFQTWAMEHNEITLVAKGGQPPLRTRLNPEIGIDEGRFVRITYRFATALADPRQWSVQYALPAPPIRQRIAFTFEDVPLP